MMLTKVFSEEKTQSIIDVMPDEMIVWKVVTNPSSDVGSRLHRHEWNSAYSHGAFTAYYRGKMAQNLPSGAMVEGAGYHSFVKKSSAVQCVLDLFRNQGREVISAIVNKADITSIGSEGLAEYVHGLTVVTSRIIMPTYPNTDITKELTHAPQLVEECDRAMELMLT